MPGLVYRFVCLFSICLACLPISTPSCHFRSLVSRNLVTLRGTGVPLLKPDRSWTGLEVPVELSQFSL